MRYYLDTSAAIKEIFDEAEADFYRNFRRDHADSDSMVSSELLRIEVARALHRAGMSLLMEREVLRGVALTPIGEEVIDVARSLTGELKSLDAIHLATALVLNCQADPVTFLSYDARLIEAAQAHGLPTLSPGVSEATSTL